MYQIVRTRPLSIICNIFSFYRGDIDLQHYSCQYPQTELAHFINKGYTFVVKRKPTFRKDWIINNG